jgi:DNA replication protein DnaC
MLYRAVEARYAAGKPTIVTVNVANDGEADLRLGAPTWDRLCHGAGKIKCEWPSYRQPAFEVS